MIVSGLVGISFVKEPALESVINITDDTGFYGFSLTYGLNKMTAITYEKNTAPMFFNMGNKPFASSVVSYT